MASLWLFLGRSRTNMPRLPYGSFQRSERLYAHVWLVTLVPLRAFQPAMVAKETPCELAPCLLHWPILYYIITWSVMSSSIQQPSTRGLGSSRVYICLWVEFIMIRRSRIIAALRIAMFLSKGPHHITEDRSYIFRQHLMPQRNNNTR